MYPGLIFVSLLSFMSATGELDFSFLGLVEVVVKIQPAAWQRCPAPTPRNFFFKKPQLWPIWHQLLAPYFLTCIALGCAKEHLERLDNPVNS